MTYIGKSYSVENVTGLGRRGLLRGVAAVSGLVLAARLSPVARAAGFANGSVGMPHGTVNNPHVFIAIAPDGTVTIVATRSEMGTGARTSLPMVVADELEADWARVKIVQADGDEPKYGNQDTDGSRSLRHFLQPMRECGAACRAMLEAAAAQKWGVPVSEVHAEHHEVLHASTGRKIGYGELAEAAAQIPVPATDTLKLKDASQFRYIGKGAVQIVDLYNITTGAATYGADVRIPGMKYVVIARPPVVGGKLKTFDGGDAMKVSGVEKVLQVQGWTPPAKFMPLGGVAVVARNTGAAIKGRDALKIVWDDGPNASYDSQAYRAQIEETTRKPGEVVRNEGDVEGALKSSAKVISAEYYTAAMSHAQMEPVVGTAHVKDGHAEIWAPVQSPGGTREDAAKLLDIPVENVTVHVTLLGGGFGRKSKCDYALEAALLSKELGAPVRVQWTREDDMQHGFYHAENAQRIDAGLDASGKLVAWRHRSTAPSILSTFKPDVTHQFFLEVGMGMVDMPFDVANVRCETGEAVNHARIGWFRSVRNIPHAFAIQTFADELAHAQGKDPLQNLHELIGPPRIVTSIKDSVKDYWNNGEPWDTYPFDAGRLRRVLDLVAEKAGWGRKMPPGEGLGIAVHRSFVSYIATVVHVAVDKKGNFTIPQVDTAIDCGFYANPERITSQIEGAAIMGISLAKYGELTFKNGRVQQSNYNDYQVARIDESPPQTNVYIVPAGLDVPPSGVGEPGLPPFAPALCNALFAATGKRIRNLPIANQLSL